MNGSSMDVTLSPINKRRMPKDIFDGGSIRRMKRDIKLFKKTKVFYRERRLQVGASTSNRNSRGDHGDVFLLSDVFVIKSSLVSNKPDCG